MQKMSFNIFDENDLRLIFFYFSLIKLNGEMKTEKL